MRRMSLLIAACSCFSFAFGYHLRTVRVTGNRFVSEGAILRAAGLRAGGLADSAALAGGERCLYGTGSFQSVVLYKQASGDTLDLTIRVVEEPRTQVSLYGVGLYLTMFNEDKLWFSLTPGCKRRFLLGRMNSLLITATFPYMYGVSADFETFGFPFRTFRSGLSLSARAFPSTYAPYYGRLVFMGAMTEKEVVDRLFLRLSVNEEIGTTWRVDTKSWKNLDWQIIVNPDDIRDTLVDGIYPTSEQAPSAALSARLDHRNSATYPTRGFLAFAEARRFWIQNLKEKDVYPFNQASGGVKAYVPVTGRQTFSAYLSATVRDTFDFRHLSHRMIFYDDDSHFRGFTALASTNLLFMDLEYRFRLFDFRYDDFAADIKLDPKREKLVRRLDYTMELFLYADNGLLWGHVLTDVHEQKGFFDLNLKKDLFTGLGAGGRLAYPGLGYVVAGGLTLYQHKEGLDKGYMPLIYTSLTGSF